ncbi:unnamed protein product, partial [Allacma fusca]
KRAQQMKAMGIEESDINTKGLLNSTGGAKTDAKGQPAKDGAKPAGGVRFEEPKEIPVPNLKYKGKVNISCAVNMFLRTWQSQASELYDKLIFGTDAGFEQICSSPRVDGMSAVMS